MSAPSRAHNLTALADRLKRIHEEVTQISTEIAAIAQVEISRSSVESDTDGGAVWTPTEAAKLLGRSRSWVHEQVRSGVIPAIRLGTRWWIRRRDLIEAGWL